MDYDLKTLPAPVNRRAVPYPPPNYLPPEDDTMESAIAMSERGKYEKAVANNNADRAVWEQGKNEAQLNRNAQIEAERTGIPVDQLLNAERGPIIPGAASISAPTVGEVGAIPPELDKMISNMARGPISPSTQEEDVPSWVIEQDALRVSEDNTKPSFKDLERDSTIKDEDTLEWAKAEIGARDTVDSTIGAIKDKSSSAIREVDGKRFISKKFIEKNKETLNNIAEDFGFGSSKEVLEALFNYKGIKEDVGSVKRGSQEFAGSSFKDLPKGDVKDDTLILPEEWKEGDLRKAEGIAKKYGLKPEEFFAFIDHETGGTFSSEVVNGIGATGLIQFVRTTAHDLLQLQKIKEEVDELSKEGTKITNETRKELRNRYPFIRDIKSSKDRDKARDDAQYLVANMGLNDQLDLVDQYLGDAARGEKGLESIYSAVFTGSPTKKSIPVSEGNEGLDKNNDGVITRKEFTKPVTDKIKYDSVKLFK